MEEKGILKKRRKQEKDEWESEKVDSEDTDDNMYRRDSKVSQKLDSDDSSDGEKVVENKKLPVCLFDIVRLGSPKKAQNFVESDNKDSKDEPLHKKHSKKDNGAAKELTDDDMEEKVDKNKELPKKQGRPKKSENFVDSEGSEDTPPLLKNHSQKDKVAAKELNFGDSEDNDKDEKVVKNKKFPDRRGRPKKAQNFDDSDSEDEPLLKKHSKKDKGAAKELTDDDSEDNDKDEKVVKNKKLPDRRGRPKKSQNFEDSDSEDEPPLKKHSKKDKRAAKELTDDDKEEKELKNKELPKRQGRPRKAKKIVDSENEDSDYELPFLKKHSKNNKREVKELPKRQGRQKKPEHFVDSDNEDSEDEPLLKKHSTKDKRAAKELTDDDSEDNDKDEKVVKNKKLPDRQGRPKKVQNFVDSDSEDSKDEPLFKNHSKKDKRATKELSDDDKEEKVVKNKELPKRQGRPKKAKILVDSDNEDSEDGPLLKKHDQNDKAAAKELTSEDNDKDEKVVKNKKMPDRQGRPKKAEIFVDSEESEDEPLLNKHSKKDKRAAKELTDDDSEDNDKNEKVVKNKKLPNRRGRPKKVQNFVDSYSEDSEDEPLFKNHSKRDKQATKELTDDDKGGKVVKNKELPKRQGRPKKTEIYVDSDNEDSEDGPLLKKHGQNDKAAAKELTSEDNDKDEKVVKNKKLPDRRGRPKKFQNYVDSDSEDEPLLKKHSKKDRGAAKELSDDDNDKEVKAVKVKELPRRRGRPKKEENFVDSNNDDNSANGLTDDDNKDNSKKITSVKTNLKKRGEAKNIKKNKKKENARYDRIKYSEFSGDDEGFDATYDPQIDLDSDESFSTRKNRIVRKLVRSAKEISIDKVTKYFKADNDDINEEMARKTKDEEDNSEEDSNDDKESKSDKNENTEVKKSPIKKRGRPLNMVMKDKDNKKVKGKKTVSKKRNVSASEDEEDSSAKKFRHVSEYNGVQLKELRIVLKDSNVDKEKKSDKNENNEVKKPPLKKRRRTSHMVMKDEDLNNTSDEDLNSTSYEDNKKVKGKKPVSKKRNVSTSESEEDSSAKKFQHVSEYDGVQLKELRIVLEHCKS